MPAIFAMPRQLLFFSFLSSAFPADFAAAAFAPLQLRRRRRQILRSYASLRFAISDCWLS